MLKDRVKKFDRVKASELVDNPANWKIHGTRQRAAMSAVLGEIGFADALLVFENETGKLELINGHMRRSLLGDETVPVLILDVDRPEAEKILASFDPLTALATKDKDRYRALRERTAFQDATLKAFVDEMAGTAPKPDEADDVPAMADDMVFDVATGDIWTLGVHRLVCGDATDPAAWAALEIPAERSIMFTSPPYNLGESMSLRRNESLEDSAYIGSDDNLSESDFESLYTGALDNALAHCAGAIINVQMLAGNRSALLRWMAGRDDLRDIITWDKMNAAPAQARHVLSSRFEWLLVFGPKPATRSIPLSTWRGTIENVYAGPGAVGNEFAKVHGATFPIHLPSWIVGSLCDDSAAVVDCFCGTGTTIIAAERLRKRAFGIEREPRYIDVALQRFQRATGITPAKIVASVPGSS